MMIMMMITTTTLMIMTLKGAIQDFKKFSSLFSTLNSFLTTQM